MDDLLREFLVETGENLDTVDARLVQLEHEPNNQDILRAIFRLVHTIKGTCGFLGLPRLESLTHAAETVMGHFRDGAPVTRDAVTLILSSIDRIKIILGALDKTGAEPEGDDSDLIAALEAMARAIRGEKPALDIDSVMFGPAITAASGGGTEPGPADAAPVETSREEQAPDQTSASASTLRVNVDTLERLMTMVSELVLTRNQLMEIARQTSDHAFGAPLQRLSLVTSELQDSVMKTRMQPISHACQKLPRLVRDLNVELGKDIHLVILGGETELDRQVLDLIKDPLTHLVRNAADHGIEMPDARIAAGKPSRGTITIAARHSGGALVLTITDDGRGLNLPRIRAKALERGLAGEAELERMSDAQAARLIFHPGFSTSEEVSAISGRGVGMDVVAANVAQAGGHVDIQSSPGAGAIFTITLPLTLAILPALLIGVRGQRFALPQSVIAELVRIGADSEARIVRMDHGAMLTLRGEVFPLLSLSQVLGFASAADAFDGERGFVALLSIDDKRFAMHLDTVLHTEEIVVKPISASLRHLQLYSGCTILGDGSVVLIFEPNALARMVGAAPVSLQIPGVQNTAEFDTPKAVPVLVLRAGQQRQAVPLSMVTRIERIASAQIESTGSQSVLQHAGALVPVLRLDGEPARDMNGSAVCLIIEYHNKKIGLLANEIIDVVETDIALGCHGSSPGVLGAAIVQGVTTDIVDVPAFLMRAFPDIAAAPQHQAAARLLLIEPCPFIRDMLAPVLCAAGFDVIVDDDPRHAAGRTASFDVIVFDLDVMTADYPDILPALQGAHGARSIMAALSSFIDPQRDASLQADGVCLVVSKFDRRGLIDGLRAALPVRRNAA